MKRIVVGIGGTNSTAYDRDWVKQFVDTVSFGPRIAVSRFFIHGPADTIWGSDSGKIRSDAFNFINANSTLLSKQSRPPRSRGPARYLKHLFEEEIWLVGHSRGAHIAIDIAKSLSKVKFLGLYDAVDRTTQLGYTRSIPASVENAYHAMRHPDLASRYSFGNTGVAGLPEANKRLFITSHGGVGGDWGQNRDPESLGFGDDVACARPSYHVGNVASRQIPYSMVDQVYDPRLADVIQSYSGSPDDAQRKLRALCGTESENAHNWMKTNARRHGASFR